MQESVGLVNKYKRAYWTVFSAIMVGIWGPVIASATVVESQYQVPEGLVEGAAFIDRILPVPLRGELRSDVWGADNVLPRDVNNGLEDAEYSYWGGNILKGDDGKYHMFVCRWPENNVKGDKSGHHTWWSSVLVRAESDHPLGPYTVMEEIGQAHNPEAYRLQDGSYVVGGVWTAAYKSSSIRGPWTPIPYGFQLLDPNTDVNETNRTYVPREDGTVLMMNKRGLLFVVEGQDEQFRQLTSSSFYPYIPLSHLEDPVMWKDEVQYNCIVNDAHGRVAFYFRSPDGINWKWVPGHAYTHTSVRHEGGTSEGWHKLERPKILQDQYGRAAYINFAAIDTYKDDDLANDIHSSKNVVVPLRVPRRLDILNQQPITSGTGEIRVKILAEEGFDPHTDVDVDSLSFGAPEEVNFGRGCAPIGSQASGADLVVTFSGQGNGITEENFAAKLIGRTTDGELLFGYASLPNESWSGELFDTHFTEDEGYMAADLARQAHWEAIEGTGANAFRVDPTGAGTAATAPVAEAAGSTNQVYWTQLMENGAGAIWTGRVTFALTAHGVVDKTRSYPDGATTQYNTRKVADLGGDHSLMFGLTVHPNDVLDPLQDPPGDDEDPAQDDVLISVCPNADGSVTFGINRYKEGVNEMLTLTAEELGWDPAWVVNAADAAPDFESEPIALDFMIRKSTAPKSYVGQVTATVNGSVYESDMVYTKDSGSWAAVDVAYAAKMLYFGLSRAAADADSRVDVSIDAISLTHADSSDIPLIAPYDVLATSEDMCTLLNWSGSGEQSRFEVWRSDRMGGPYNTFLGDVSATYFRDDQLTAEDDRRTYFYALKAVYPGGEKSDFSAEAAGRIKRFGQSFNLKGDFSSRTWKGTWDHVSAASVSNGIEFRTGTGSYTGRFGDGSLFVSENNNYTNNISSAPYGVFQCPEVGGFFELATQANGPGAADMIKQTLPPGSSSLLWVEGPPTDMTQGTFSITMVSDVSEHMHAAVRNGSTWYVCERTQTDKTNTIANVKDESWLELEPATAASTTLMTVKGLNDYVPGVDLNLTNVNALGVFRDTDPKDGPLWWWGFELSYGTVLTPYEKWCDEQQIYNEDAASTNDLDGDGLSNYAEWGLGGDPQDRANAGIAAQGFIDDGNGMMVYVHPVRQGARPTYTMESTTNLVRSAFAPEVPGREPVEGGDWPGRTGYNSMTNFVPMDSGQKFIRVKVE